MLVSTYLKTQKKSADQFRRCFCFSLMIPCQRPRRTRRESANPEAKEMNCVLGNFFKNKATKLQAGPDVEEEMSSTHSIFHHKEAALLLL